MEQPFGPSWVKEISKLSKSELKENFGVDGKGTTKAVQIEIIRANLIVKQFNQNHPVGSAVRWRSTGDDFSPFETVTVESEAFVGRMEPVVFFVEKVGFCSIEPEFLEL